MKNLNIGENSSTQIKLRSAFANVVSNPQNGSDVIVDSCHGYTCIIQGSRCLAGSPGSLGVNWTCKNYTWTRD